MCALLSVLIPTRDRLEFLKVSLASAQAQTLHDIEILVSDDGSADETTGYVRSVSGEDPRVRLLTVNPQPGAFENIGHLIRHATAGALVVLGDDDVLLPCFGERLLPALDDPAVHVAFCQFEAISSDGQRLPRRTAELYRHHGFADTPGGRLTDGMRAALKGQMWLGSCLYRTAVIQRLGLDLACGSAADLDLALRATKQGAAYFIPEVLWLYRDHPGTISRGAGPRATAAAIKVLESHRAATVDDESLRLDQLRALLAMQAWKSVVTDPTLATESLQRFDSIEGDRLEPRRLLSRILLRFTPSLRRTLHTGLVMAVAHSRAIRRWTP